ncbi:TIR domain-containing protein [Sphingomonas rhizophila]|uniref:TIR domain-containing protein n=1 Tax=Sphingomonas rhizophila TaxID=2071607 RepID=A0A7G9SAX0_9SPHN|nr:TIR domain-containing protein [Sphingomonas rhizophila]QNN64995.1 TIR domain-containing protein [Sphingomonas rhizophila]
MADQKKNVFISHIHEDDEGLGKLKDLLAKSGMSIRDASINSSNPNNAQSEDYIKSQILAPQIDWAGTMVVYVTPDTKDSDWVDWEIRHAHQKDKRIVGVWAHGCHDCELPPALNDLADAVVGWNGTSVVDAINGDCDVWERPDGTPAEVRPIKRHCC